MQIIRTAFWVALALVFFMFSWANWKSVEIQLAPAAYWTTRLPVPILLAFLLGFLPTWLVHKAGKWRLKRKISALENSVRVAAPPDVAPTSTQVDATDIDPEDKPA